MKRRIGAAVLAVFVGLSIALPVAVAAQVVVPCPYYCTMKGLQEAYGEDWHLWYFLLGCWQLPSSCTGVEGQGCAVGSRPTNTRPRIGVR